MVLGVEADGGAVAIGLLLSMRGRRWRGRLGPVLMSVSGLEVTSAGMLGGFRRVRDRVTWSQGGRLA